MAKARRPAKLKSLRGGKRRPKAKAKRRKRPPLIRFCEVDIRITAQHIERARAHGGKCPLWVALREATGLPWCVRLRCYNKRDVFEVKVSHPRFRRGGINLLPWARQPFVEVLTLNTSVFGCRMGCKVDPFHPINDLLDLFWEPRGDRAPVELLVSPKINVFVLTLQGCPVRMRELKV